MVYNSRAECLLLKMQLLRDKKIPNLQNLQPKCHLVVTNKQPEKLGCIQLLKTFSWNENLRSSSLIPEKMKNAYIVGGDSHLNIIHKDKFK